MLFDRAGNRKRQAKTICSSTIRKRESIFAGNSGIRERLAKNISPYKDYLFGD